MPADSFESTDSVTNCVGHDKKWSRYVVPAERLPPEGETIGTGRAFNPGVGIEEDQLLERGQGYVREKLQLRTEYQTLSRLPKSNQVLFTVRTYVNPLVETEKCPAAAQALAAAVRRKYKGMMYYMGIVSTKSRGHCWGSVGCIVPRVPAMIVRTGQPRGQRHVRLADRAPGQDGGEGLPGGLPAAAGGAGGQPVLRGLRRKACGAGHQVLDGLLL